MAEMHRLRFYWLVLLLIPQINASNSTHFSVFQGDHADRSELPKYSISKTTYPLALEFRT